jgi:hypothetical protein
MTPEPVRDPASASFPALPFGPILGAALALAALQTPAVLGLEASWSPGLGVPAEEEIQISGTIVDDEGVPVPFGRALIWGPKGFYVEMTADESGDFQGSGLPAGRLGLRAAGEAPDCMSAGDSRPGEIVEVDLRDGKSLGDLTLRLLPSRTVRGRLTLHGKPVPEAGLQARLEGGVDVSTVSGEDGTFLLVVPKTATRATLMVNGGEAPAQAFEVQLDGADLQVKLQPRSGALEIRLPSAWAQLNQAGGLLSLEANGRELPESWIYEAEPASLKNRALRLDRMAPGPYRVCLGPAGLYGLIDPEARDTKSTACAEGTLVPGGTLRLAVAAADISL